jgi:hypothetical protein
VLTTAKSTGTAMYLLTTIPKLQVGYMGWKAQESIQVAARRKEITQHDYSAYPGIGKLRF